MRFEMKLGVEYTIQIDDVLRNGKTVVATVTPNGIHNPHYQLARQLADVSLIQQLLEGDVKAVHITGNDGSYILLHITDLTPPLPSSLGFVTLYELDDQNEATGQLRHFCSETCANAWKEDEYPRVGWGHDAEIIADEVCAECSKPLVRPS